MPQIQESNQSTEATTPPTNGAINSEAPACIPKPKKENENPTFDELKERALGFDEATVAGILGKAQTVYEAKQKLEKEGRQKASRAFDKFCDELHLKGSQIRKWAKIGEEAKAGRFDKVQGHLPKLPIAWSTIYRLSVIERADFNRIVATGKLQWDFRLKDIDLALGKEENKDKSKKPKQEDNEPVIVAAGMSILRLCAGKMDEDQKRENLQKVEAFAKELGFTVEIPNGVATPEEA